MKRKQIGLAALALVAVAATGTVVALATTAHGSLPGGALARLSNHGRPVATGPGQKTELATLEATQASLLAEREGRTFYRLAKPDGGVCFAVNLVPASDHIGNTTCPLTPTAFPVPDRPVLDFSIWESTSHVGDDYHLISGQGIAADGVRAVALLDSSGRAIARARVVDNVYTLDVPRGKVAKAIVAYDDGGEEVFREA